MYIFYAIVLIVVIIAYIKVRNATGEIEYLEDDPPPPVKPRKRKATESSESPWTYSGEGGGFDAGGSHGGGFDGGGSHDGGGSSTHF